MPIIKHISGFEAILKELGGLEKVAGGVFVLFCGAKDKEGNSWCPDCVKAEPVVKAAAENLDKKDVFIHCDVGERTFWKDQKNPFRTHEQFKLTGVPTLLKWKTAKRLVEEQCMDQSLVEMLFED